MPRWVEKTPHVHVEYINIQEFPALPLHGNCRKSLNWGYLETTLGQLRQGNKDTNAHRKLDKDVCYVATNTKAFTGIPTEKEQRYSMLL